MTHEKASQPGAEEPSASAPQAGHHEAEAPPRTRVASRPRPAGYAAAFGDASGAAFVFRDLASI